MLLPLAGGSRTTALLILLIMQAGDVVGAVYMINETSLRQMLAPDHLRGRVNANFTVWTTSVLLIGSLIGGALGQLIGLRATLAIAASGGFVTALLLWRSPVRHLRAVPLAERPPDQIVLA